MKSKFAPIRFISSAALAAALCFAGTSNATAQVLKTSLNLLSADDDFLNGVVVNTVTNKVYVGTTLSNSIVPAGRVFVVDGVTNAITTVAGVIPTENLAVNTSTNKIYVPKNDPFNGSYEIQVIDGATDAVSTFTLGAGKSATFVVSAQLPTPSMSSGTEQTVVTSIQLTLRQTLLLPPRCSRPQLTRTNSS